MASIETLQASFDRFEREQKARDDGLRRAFHMFADALKRLQETVETIEADHRLPMDMGQFITLMTTMLNRQQQLLESIGERVDDEVAWETETGVYAPSDESKAS